MANSISPADLSSEIGKVLQTFEHSVVTDVDTASGKVAAQAVKMLRGKNQGAHRWTKYPKGWTSSRKKSGVVYIHNAKSYRLTHLLEKGHRLVYGGHVVGHASSYSHIQEVEEYVKTHFDEAIKHEIQH